MQGASVKQTRSVCSERARTPAGGRSRCVFAKQIRGFSAQSFSPKQMRCYRISAGHAPHQRNPKPAENRTLCRARALSKREAFVARGRGRRQPAEAGAYLRSKYADSPRKASTLCRCDTDRTAACHAPHQRRPRRKIHPRIPAQTGMRFPDDVSSGNCIPESTFGMGFIFRKTPQADSSSRNPRSERDTLSQRRSKRKVHPGIPPQTGTRFPLHILNSKTYAPSIPKLGRRKPKRNRRRSI